MHLGLPRFLHEAIGLSSTQQSDEHLLAGADEAAVQALGASAPVLSIFHGDFAALSPDLVHEAQRTIGRH